MSSQKDMEKKIAEAFYNVLKKSSFSKAKVTNITEEAGISHQTFYRYYLDKYDLAYKITKEKFFAFHDIYSDSATWKEIVIIILNSIKNYPVFFKKMLEDPEGAEIILNGIIAVTEKFTGTTLSRHPVCIWISIFKEWSSNDFKTPVEDIYHLIKIYTSLKEVLPPEEIDRIMEIYENQPLDYFRTR
ncbi:MAG: TetR/AcrR family transcriptional regulator [Lachnospiraceae bacterium]|nr:TetR/AcrR family transcriptional regulator [Lachnospiraceae bacterium]